MQRWSEESGLYLFTVEEFNRLPAGVELTCINNTIAVKGKDEIDLGVRFGHIAFGVKDPWNHPLKDIFLVFKLMQ